MGHTSPRARPPLAFLLLLAACAPAPPVVAPAAAAAPLAPVPTTAASAAAPPSARPPAPTIAATLDEIDGIVRARIVDPAILERRRWADNLATARTAAAAPGADRVAILEHLVDSLATSHTEYLPPSDPRFAQLLSIFERTLARPSPLCEDLSRLPPSPFSTPGIDAFFRPFEGRWFVNGLVTGGLADRGGLLTGDEVLLADGAPFSPVASFRDRASAVTLTVRRRRDAAPFEVKVTPRSVPPRELFKELLRASARVLERGPARIGYVHVWSWAGDDVEEELEAAIDRLNREHLTGFILDIRDGWGGASAAYMRIFDRRIPVLESTMRDGSRYRTDPQIRVPAVLLTNAGTRSGKETIAYAVKKHHLATLVGERTAGSVLAGSPFCLNDGGVLFLAVGDVRVDGERLDGRGVVPDREVPFDVRYAAGVDPRLEEAVRVLTAGPG